jgi:bla regulator protein BlaR1
MIPVNLSAIGTAMANHLRQSTLFAMVAAVFTLALHRNQAAIRHRLWLAASLKFFVPFSLLMSLGS